MYLPHVFFLWMNIALVRVFGVVLCLVLVIAHAWVFVVGVRGCCPRPGFHAWRVVLVPGFRALGLVGLVSTVLSTGCPAPFGVWV